MARLRGKYLRMLVTIFSNTKADNARSNGTVYYVDGNFGADTNDGLSWDTPFATLAVAFAASHADIASGSNRWARRNTIYCAGDWFVEDLVTLPQKTDVIGVGSCDGFKGAGITGNHAPVNTAIGTRFYNIIFRPTAATDLMILTTACTAVEFHNCQFQAVNGGTYAPSGIDATGSVFLKVIGCEFSGGFTADYIDIGAGAIVGTIIKDNIMTGGADNGIMVTGTGTITANRRGSIIGNFIECADIVIDVNSTSVFNVMNNVGISGEALGASSYVIDLTFASNNVITGNDVSATIPVGSSS